MLTQGINGNGAPRRWSPAPYAPPVAQYQALRPAPKLGAGETPISAAESLMRSPVIALGTDLAAAVAGGFLGYALNVRRNKCLKVATAPASKVVGKTSDGQPIYGGGYDLEIALTKCPSTTWITFWWILATAMGVKALHDLSEMNA